MNSSNHHTIIPPSSEGLKRASIPVITRSVPPASKDPEQKRLQLLKRAMVFRKILLLNDGRDKILKCAQYSAKLLLWAYLSNNTDSHAKATKIATQFSIARKIVRLGHWLEPLNDHFELLAKDGALFNPTTDNWLRLLTPFYIWVSIMNDISDDIVCIGKMGLIDKAWVDWATPISDKLWFSTIFFDVYENMHASKKLSYAIQQTREEQEKSKLLLKMHVQRVSLLKLFMDLVFCTVDVFQLGGRASDGWQVVSGLLAAFLGTYKLYIKNK